ncbi:MAG: amidohydrolase [Pseudomonadota bacterium]
MAADILIINAQVKTMDSAHPDAEAIAIKANKILEVGTSEQITRHRNEQTKTIDARGATVLPGFVEAHAHIFPGSKSLEELDLQKTQGADALSKELADYATDNPEHTVLIGRSVNYGILGEGTRLTRHDLDKIVSDRPVFLRSGDYHNAWVNTLALEKAGALHGQDTGKGSEIVLDKDGIATGELREFAAMEYVLSRLAPPSRDHLGLAGSEPENLTNEQRLADKNLIKKGLDYCASHGITTIQNMDGNFYQCDLLKALEAEGKLSCRIEVPYHFLPAQPVEDLEHASRMTQTFNSEKLWSGRIKMFMDGVLDAWTAVMIEDYADRPGEKGTPLFTAEHFNAVSIEAQKRGLQISVHAIGDGAVRMTLDGYEAAAKANGNKGFRHRIEHIEVVHPEDIPRFKNLGVLASMQPIHAPGNGCFPKEPTIHMIGKARWPFAYAWRTLKSSGADVVYGTDWPVSPVDPLLSIKHALTRKPWAPDNPDQRLTFEETLAAYTAIGAYTCFKEESFGVLKQGMLADIVILDGNFPDNPDEESVWPKVRLTLCDGEITYDAEP